MELERAEAVVLDMDGVVTDTASVHAEAWRETFDDFLAHLPPAAGEGHRGFTRADYLQFVDGKARESGVRDFLASRGITVSEAEVRDVAERKTRLVEARLAAEGVRVFPGTRELLAELRRRVPIAVVSASRRARAVLAAAGLSDAFDVTVDGVDAAALRLASKPDPALYLEAARRLRVAPARTALVEDALAGVTAGRRGGFGLVIGVDRSGRPGQRDALLAAGADVVVEDLKAIRIGAEVR
jgi:beta-phosphoglucomutase family hydrolase